jgi:DNA polymerase-4
VGNGITFKRDLTGRDDIRTAVKALSDRVAGRLRAHRLKCGGVKIDIKDPDFRSISRQTQLSRATDLGGEIFEAAMDLMGRHWRSGDPVRLLAVTGIQLVGADEDVQLDLFSSNDPFTEQQRAVEETVDSIREKFGRYAIVYGGLINNDLGISTGDDREEIEYEEV